MPINEILQNITILLLYAAILLVLFFVPTWIIIKLSLFVSRCIAKTRVYKKCQEWVAANKNRIIFLWEYLSEIYIDPIFYILGLYFVTTRLDVVIANIKLYPEFTFLQLLEYDMEINMSYYIAFLVLFFLWILWRSWNYKNKKQNRELLTESLQSINDKLDKMLDLIVNKTSNRIRRGNRYARRNRCY